MVKMKRTNHFYVYIKKDHLRIETVNGTELGRTERLIEAGWKLIGIFNENTMQFMVDGKITSILNKSFNLEKEISQENSCDVD